MDDVPAVHVLDPAADLVYGIGGAMFGNCLVFHILLEVASGQQLQNEVDVLLVIEEAVHAGQVFVFQEGLDFDLAQDDLLVLLLSDF
jgi:hypothetical protein